MWLAVKRLSVFGALGTTGATAVCNAWRCSLGFVPNGGLNNLNRIVVLVMLATWVVADKRISGRSQASFDQGWFVLVLPVYVPYYLVATRGWRGLLLLVAMFLLFLLTTIPEALFCDIS